jgi:hypothetical protein
MTNRDRMRELNTDRIANLTTEQINAVHHIMATNARYADELLAVVIAGGAEGPVITDMEIRAVLYTMAGTLQVTMTLDAVLTGGAR